MAYPDWQQVFIDRPDLNPPGYQETMDSFINNPYVSPKQKKAARAKKKTHFPSLKHGSQP